MEWQPSRNLIRLSTNLQPGHRKAAPLLVVPLATVLRHSRQTGLVQVDGP